MNWPFTKMLSTTERPTPRGSSTLGASVPSSTIRSMLSMLLPGGMGGNAVAAPLLEPVSRTVVFNCSSFLSGRPIPRSQAEVTMLLPGGYPGPQSAASPTKTNGTARRPSSSSPRAPTPIAAMHAMSASRLDIGTSLSAFKRTLKKNSQGALRQSDVEYQFVTNERMELHFDVIHRTGPSYACPAGELPREIFQLARAAPPTRSWAMVACLCTAPFAT